MWWFVGVVVCWCGGLLLWWFDGVVLFGGLCDTYGG